MNDFIDNDHYRRSNENCNKTLARPIDPSEKRALSCRHIQCLGSRFLRSDVGWRRATVARKRGRAGGEPEGKTGELEGADGSKELIEINYSVANEDK